MNFPPIDWHTAFAFSVHPLEIVLRGTLVYLFLFTVFRVLRRDAGTISLGDLLVVTLIADASQNAMANEYKSITDGLILISTIIGWNYLLDWLAYRYPRLRPWLEPPLRELIRDGQMLRNNLRKEMISVEELMRQLREHGIDDISSVKRCCLESDGRISVIENEG